MKILAIDTTTKKAGVALKDDNNIYFKEIDNEITHSEKLLPLIDEVLHEACVNLQDIDLLAVTLGPGSFTGVRIGISTVKAIAKVINKKILGTTSLELLALDGITKCGETPKYILSLMDARNQRVYYNLYKYNNNKLETLDFAGNDYAKEVIEKVQAMKLEDVLVVIDNNNNINLENVIEACLDLKYIFELDMSSNLYDYLNLDALYYRKSEAERTTEGE